MKMKKQILLLSLFIQLLIVINLNSQITEKCGTFSSDVLAKIGMSCSRPNLYPAYLPKQTIETMHFIVHFIINDTLLYNPLEPVSDITTYNYAQKIAQAAEASWNFQINTLRWQIPPPDGNCGVEIINMISI